MKIVFKSWKFWVLMAGSAIVTIFLAWGSAWSVYANIKLDTPTNLSVVSLSTGEIYAEVDNNTRASGYEFVIWSTQTNAQKYTSQTNIINISSLMQIPNNYQIKCRILGKTTNANSEYCTTVEYSSAVKIEKPTISFKADDATKLLFVLEDSFSQSVTLSFELYYKVNDEGEFLKNTNFNIISGTNRGEAQGYFDLASILTEEGEYSLAVRVLSPANAFYLASDLSNQIVYTVD